MVGNTKTPLEITNYARQLGGYAQTVAQDDLDKNFYEYERVSILTRTDFAFARKEVAKDTLVDAGDGFYELPDDYLNVVAPPFLDRLGDNVKFQSSTLRYTSNITDHLKFSTAFVDILSYGIATRYSRERGDVVRTQMNNNERMSLLAQTKKREGMNMPLRVRR